MTDAHQHVTVPPVGPYALQFPAETPWASYEGTDVRDDMRGDYNKCTEEGAGMYYVERLTSGNE